MVVSLAMAPVTLPSRIDDSLGRGLARQLIEEVGRTEERMLNRRTPQLSVFTAKQRRKAAQVLAKRAGRLLVDAMAGPDYSWLSCLLLRAMKGIDGQLMLTVELELI